MTDEESGFVMGLEAAVTVIRSLPALTAALCERDALREEVARLKGEIFAARTSASYGLHIHETCVLPNARLAEYLRGFASWDLPSLKNAYRSATSPASPADAAEPPKASEPAAGASREPADTGRSKA